MPEIEYDLSRIFQRNTHLHLLCWNIQDVDLHRHGLLLVSQLLGDKTLQGLVMPMIRPAGRKSLACYSGFLKEHGDPTADQQKYAAQFAQYTDCEVWIQVAECAEERVWDWITKWIDRQGVGFARRSMTDPMNRPYGLLGKGAEEYCLNRTEFRSGAIPKYYLSHFQPDDLFKLIKLIWARATIPTISAAVQNAQVTLVDPRKQTSCIKQIFRTTLTSFSPKDCGLNTDLSTVDPTDIVASHMALFAVNAICSHRPDYRLEAIWGMEVTRPYFYPNLEDFLSSF